MSEEFSEEFVEWCDLIDRLKAFGDYKNSKYRELLFRYLEIAPKALVKHPDVLQLHNEKLRKEIERIQEDVDSSLVARMREYLP